MPFSKVHLGGLFWFILKGYMPIRKVGGLLWFKSLLKQKMLIFTIYLHTFKCYFYFETYVSKHPKVGFGINLNSLLFMDCINKYELVSSCT